MIRTLPASDVNCFCSSSMLFKSFNSFWENPKLAESTRSKVEKRIAFLDILHILSYLGSTELLKGFNAEFAELKIILLCVLGVKMLLMFVR